MLLIFSFFCYIFRCVNNTFHGMDYDVDLCRGNLLMIAGVFFLATFRLGFSCGNCFYCFLFWLLLLNELLLIKPVFRLFCGGRKVLLKGFKYEPIK